VNVRLTLVSSALAVLVLLTATLGVLVPPIAPADGVLAPRAPLAGGVVCSVGGPTEQGSGALDLLALTVPAALVDEVVGDEDGPAVQEGLEPPVPTLVPPAEQSLLQVRVLGSASRTLDVPATGAGDHVRIAAGLRTDEWVWVGWSGRPAITLREWFSDGGPGVPRGRLGGACPAATAVDWTLTGLRTDGGHEAFVHVANPYTTDATFAMTLITAEQTERPIALRNVSVPPGGRVVIRINDHLPQAEAVAAVIEVGAGRVAVEGLLYALAGLGGVEGLSLVPAATAVATAWTIPWLVSDPESEGWVTVLNPSDRVVDVAVVVHTARSATIPETLDVITLEPGELLRIPAADLAPAARVPFAVTLQSDSAAIHVAGGVRFGAEEIGATGLVVVPAAPAADRVWLLGGHMTPARTTELHIVNTGTETARIDAQVVHRDMQGARSDMTALSVPDIPAGAVQRVPVRAPGTGSWSVIIRSDVDVVVGHTAFGTERLDPLATLGTPSRAWDRAIVGSSGRFLDGWSRRLGGESDLRRPALERAAVED